MTFIFRSANIPCVVINGMSKHGYYEVGDDLNRDALLSKWNAVYVNGEWRLVDPHWASSIPDGTYRDQVFVDDAGNITITDELGNKDGEDRPVNEFFFLCDPEKLIWTHFPDDEKWQLLEKPIDLQRFKDQPYLREYFHSMGLEVSADYPETDCCVLRPDGRPSRISFNLPPDKGKHYSFKFTINEVDVEIGEEKDPKDLEQNVMMEKMDTYVRFTTRFPFIGRFHLDIYGCDEKSEMSYRLLCSYLIDCGIPCKNCKGFPRVPEHGWGPHPLAEKIGLVPISPKSNIIKTDTGIVEVKLPASMCNNMCHALKSVAVDDAMLTNHAIGRFSNDLYFVNMRLPEAGEYTLEIYADVDALQGKLPDTNVMTFLIEFTGDATNAPFPVVLGSHLGPKPGAKKLGIEALESANGVVMAWDGKLTLQFNAKSNIKMFNELSSNDVTARKLMKIQDKQEGSTWTYDLDLPLPGIYSLNLYGWDDVEKQKKVNEIFSYLIQSTGYITKEELEKQRKANRNKNRRRSRSRSPRRTDDYDTESRRASTSKTTKGDSADDKAISKTAEANKLGQDKANKLDQDGSSAFNGETNGDFPFLGGSVIGSKAAPAATSFGANSGRGSTSEGKQRHGDNNDKQGASKRTPVSLRGNGNAMNNNNNDAKSGQSSSQGQGEDRPKTKGSVKSSKSKLEDSTSGTNSKANVTIKSKDANKMTNGVTPNNAAANSNAGASKARAGVRARNAANKDKSVKFDSNALGSLIVKTYVTSENIVHIPIAKPLNTIFTSLKRRDANEKHGDKVMVIKKDEGLELRIKGYGEYQVDVMWKGDGSEISMIGRYTVIRKPKRGRRKAASATSSKLFGSGFVDASIWNSDGTVVREKTKDNMKNKVEKEAEKIAPDLRSINSADMYEEDMQERFTEGREMLIVKLFASFFIYIQCRAIIGTN